MRHRWAESAADQRSRLNWLWIGLILGGLAMAPALNRPHRPDLLDRVKARLIHRYMLESAGGPYATTDRHLRTLEVPRPAEAVLAALKDVPEDAAIVFIMPPDLPDPLLTFYSTSYLAWPRRIGKLTCGRSPQPVLLDGAAGPVNWLFFYRLDVPADLLPSAKKIGSHLALVPVKELREWRSACSPSGS